MIEQVIWKDEDRYDLMEQYIRDHNDRSIFLVCGTSCRKTKAASFFNTLHEKDGITVHCFSGFEPNPNYESVVEGVRLFRQSGSSLIIALGGGSAMDVAKCIKLFAYMDPSRNYLEQDFLPNNIRLLAIPATAGTGSEATKFAVIYYQGEKQSITLEDLIPSCVLMDSRILRTLPEYQRKSTMLDAFCHAIESFWSVHSNDTSRQYSREVIRKILRYKDGYLSNTDEGNAGMLEAAHLAGKAINITQTTAGHAMCYKLAGIYHLPHGYAAALCVESLWPYMIDHMDSCVDPRGKDYLEQVFHDLADCMQCPDAKSAAIFFHDFLKSLNMQRPQNVTEAEIDLLKKSVNPVRLKNNPVSLSEEAAELLYRRILGKELS